VTTTRETGDIGPDQAADVPRSRYYPCATGSEHRLAVGMPGPLPDAPIEVVSVRVYRMPGRVR
jgi:hypothetical protein